jgi:hypothetical protein
MAYDSEKDMVEQLWKSSKLWRAHQSYTLTLVRLMMATGTQARGLHFFPKIAAATPQVSGKVNRTQGWLVNRTE